MIIGLLGSMSLVLAWHDDYILVGDYYDTMLGRLKIDLCVW